MTPSIWRTRRVVTTNSWFVPAQGLPGDVDQAADDDDDDDPAERSSWTDALAEVAAEEQQARIAINSAMIP